MKPINLIHAIVFLSIFDVILGYSKAYINHKLNSTVGSKGIIKHGLLIFGPLAALPLANEFNLTVYWMGMCSYIAIIMLQSCAENWKALGLPIPASLVKRIDDEKMKLDNPTPTVKIEQAPAKCDHEEAKTFDE